MDAPANPTRHATDRIGQRFGRWTVIAVAGYPHHPRSLYLRCRCDCGTVKNIFLGNLLKKDRPTRGCLNCMRARQMIATDARWKARGLTVAGRVLDKHGHKCIRLACARCGGFINRSSHGLCRRCAGLSRRGVPTGPRLNSWGFIYPETLEAVGRRYGVTREAIRLQVEKLSWDGMIEYMDRRHPIKAGTTPSPASPATPLTPNPGAVQSPP